MDWLAQIVKGFLQAVLPFLWKKAEQPDVITNEDKAVDKIKSRADADVRERVLDNEGGDSASGLS